MTRLLNKHVTSRVVVKWWTLNTEIAGLHHKFLVIFCTKVAIFPSVTTHQLPLQKLEMPFQ